jgi:hypothetical protein
MLISRIEYTHRGSSRIKPAPEDIQRVLDRMRDGPMLSPPGTTDNDENAPLWWVVAIDPAGVERGIGTDITCLGAAVASWILVWLEDEVLIPCWAYGVGLDRQSYLSVPLQIPDGWTFEVDDCPHAGTA